MSSGTPKTIGGDHLIRALIRGSTVRVVAAVTTELGREAATRHQASPLAAVALGRAATAALLLATLTKDKERVTLKLSGEGPLGGLTVDANAAGEVRAYARNPGALGALSLGPRLFLGSMLGSRGIVQVARDLGLREVVSGQTPILDGEVDSDVEHYLRMSEQVDSVLVSDVVLKAPTSELGFAGGLLLQALPDAGADEFLADLRARLHSGGLIAPQDPGPTLAADLARAALGPAADDLQILDVRPLRFHCPCSRPRAASTLALLGDELQEMVDKGETTSVTCEFCRAQYDFSVEDITDILLRVDLPAN